MKTAPILKTEVDRLKEVLKLEILDTPPDQEFDEITALASEICQTPVALVTIIDAERQWFKSKIGMPFSETPRLISFCGHVIWSDEMLVVENALLDERFKDNPMTLGPAPVIFYAGAPLRTASGHGIGALCVIDHKPRVLSSNQLQSLQTLSRNVSQILNLRIQNQKIKTMACEIAQKEMALIESAKMASLGQMAAGVAHEVNTPLAIISLLASQVKDELDSKSVDRNRLKIVSEKIQSTVSRIAKIVRGLRDFSRDGSGDPFSEVNADIIIEETLAFCSDRIKLSGIELKCNYSKGLKLECRAVEISQVILNLLNNSFDALSDRAEKKVELSIQDQGNQIDFKISDNGPGVPEALRQSIFHPFFTTKEVGKGTGLGLSVSKKIIESHGGTISLNSSDRGAEFLIRLPKFQAPKIQRKLSAS